MDAIRQPTPVDLLAELLMGYRHPAALTDDAGAVVCRNTAALSETTAIVVRWPPLATLRTSDGLTLVLRCPSQAADSTAPPKPELPPRLAKIASLVIDGLTDKQIAQRTGLTFSTVRTYVRQIYRRLGVHNRVGLVHASRPALSSRG